MNYLARRRYNVIDIASVYAAGVFVAQGHYLIGVCTWIGGAIVSVSVEMYAEAKRERRDA